MIRLHSGRVGIIPFSCYVAGGSGIDRREGRFDQWRLRVDFVRIVPSLIGGAREDCLISIVVSFHRERERDGSPVGRFDVRLDVRNLGQCARVDVVLLALSSRCRGRSWGDDLELNRRRVEVCLVKDLMGTVSHKTRR